MIRKLLLSFLFLLLPFLKIRSEKFSFKIVFVAIFLGLGFNTMKAQCTTPTNIRGDNESCNGYIARWNGSATAFYIDVATTNTFALGTIVSAYNNKNIGNANNVTLTGLNPSTNYFFRVRALGSSCTSGNSATGSFTTLSVAAPTNARGDNVSCGGYIARWDGSSTNFYLDVATTMTFDAGTILASYNNKDVGNANNITLSGLSANTNYYFRVRRLDNCGLSGNSNVATFKTLSIVQPTASAATNLDCAAGQMNWNAVTNASGYYFDIAKDAGFTNILPNYNNFYISYAGYYVSGLPGGTLYFRVRSTDNCANLTAYSNVINFTPKGPIGGDVSPAQNICTGAKPTTDLTLTGNSSPVQNWQSASDINFTSNVTYIAGNTNVLTSTAIGNLTQSTYFRAVVLQTGTNYCTGYSTPVLITVGNSISAGSSAPTVCVNTNITPITHTTVGFTAIGTPANLPPGITASFNNNTITISGSSLVAGSYDYSIPLNGNCGTANATGKIIISGGNTVTTSSNPTICNGVIMTSITHTTTGATGIGTISGLPNGVTASLNANSIIISGTPTQAGSFPYSIQLTGGCGTVNATGTITVNSESTAPTGITGTTAIYNGSNTTLTVTGGTLGTNAVVEWFSGSCGGTLLGTGNSITVSPASNASTVYYVRYKGTCNTTACVNVTVNVTAPPCVPAGDQVTAGNESWIGYVYKWTGATPNPAIGALPGNANVIYIGNVTEPKLFDRNIGDNAIAGATTTINCETAPINNFFVRYKMTTTTETGMYQFTVGGDDGTRLYIDGNLVVTRWNNHGYTADMVQYQLSAGSHEFVLEYYEDGGGARVSFSYGLPKGDPTVFGDNVWNVYGYNISDISLPVANYAGMYVDAKLSFDTNILWSKAQSPSFYSGWQGVPMPIDNFAFSYKREGFPCGNYQIDLANFDDDIEIYINGTRVYNANGYQTVSRPVGTFLLNKTSKVEVRVREAGGDANAALNLKLVDNPYLGGATPTSANTPITIATSMPLSTDIEVCSCTIKSGVIFTIPADRTLTVYENITVEAGGKLLIENGGSLLQKSTSKTLFSGSAASFELQKTTQPVRRYDQTYWGTPVMEESGFKLNQLSPLTFIDKYLSYNSLTNAWFVEFAGDAVMIPGKGYNVRAPQSYDIAGDGVIFKTSFFGVPNNGDIPVTTANGNWTLAGNPYPSAVDAASFIRDNGTSVGTLYFWTHASPPKSTYTGVDQINYNSADYASFNLTGGIITADPATSTSNAVEPSGFIGAGQGFFFRAGNGAVKFTNDMRVVGKNTQFFKTEKTEEVEKSRVYLNFKNKDGAFKQILIGYINGATNDWDINYDAATMNGNTYVDFYSINSSKKLAIQGRALPFDNTEIVPLGYKSTIAGDFTIAIDHVDGVFTNQPVYLEDKLTGKIQNLTTGNYTFTTAIGTFTDRFVLRYTDKTLGTGDFENLENTVLVSVKDKVIKVNTSKETIKDVVVFDISGKQLYDKKKIETTELQISNLQSSNQILLVKVTLENDFTKTTKIIFK